MASDKVITVSVANFEEEVLKAPGLVMVDFWAAWCGPCRMVAPVVEELADLYGNDMKVCKLNVDENPDLAIKYQVLSIPTLVLFKDGEAVDRMLGAKRRHQYEATIEKHL